MTESSIGFDPKQDPGLAARTGYLQDGEMGREDLFHTKLFELKSSEENPEADNVMVISRDPGSASSLISVLRELRDMVGVHLSVITDGRAEDILRDNFDLHQIESNGALGADKILENPDLILTEVSEEQGLETYANATYEDVPMVIVNSYYDYGCAFLQAAAGHKKRPGLHPPEKICVIDEAAKGIILDKVPELEDRIVVTGSPAFDRIANEDVEKISCEAREKMGVGPDEKVISFMSIPNVSDQIEQILEQIKSAEPDFVLVFRKHPRDNMSYDNYFDLFKEKGIRYVDSEKLGLTTDQVSAASDLVMTFWSTAGLEAIHRGKPTIHITDRDLFPRITEIEMPLPLPFVKLGASVEADHVDEISKYMDQLLNPDSDLFRSMQENIRKYYPNDGKSAERVAAVVSEVLELKRQAG